MTAPVVTPPAETRFAFGRNWQAFLTVLNEERIERARQALAEMLGVTTLEGRTFLDVGSGSGLSSLAAMRLGARRVHSFDYDQQSVACTRELRRRFYPDSPQWRVEQGSALDRAYLDSLGQWDVVYSWGVLHHTGALADALDNASALVAPGGLLFVALYNDQGWRSRAWTTIKRMYNQSAVLRAVIVAAFVPYYVVGGAVVDLARGRSPRQRYRAHVRGMSPIYDWFDWLGGYPFEVLSREAVTAYYQRRDFALVRLNSCGSKCGCNEFVFQRC